MKTLAFVIFAWSLQIEARVFSLKDSQFAGYMSGTYGNSLIQDNFFEGESSATSFSKGFKTNIGGDFGFLYRSGNVGWLFGFEIIKPPKIKGATASGNGSNSYQYDSDIFVFIPKLGVELILYQSDNMRFSINGAVGSASANIDNSYKALTIAPNTNFSVKGEGTANLLSSGVGVEWHLNDNATLVFQTQYRDLRFRKLKYSEAVSSSFQGAQPSGATMTNIDGTKRKLDFTGLYTALGLRFWLF